MRSFFYDARFVFSTIYSKHFHFLHNCWHSDCYVSKELEITVATTLSRCLARKALTKYGYNLSFTTNLAVTTALFCLLNKYLRGITMSIKTKVLLAIGSLSVLSGLLMPMGIAQAGERFVSVPSNYVYDTSGRSGKVSLHDYCTKSPDEFPNGRIQRMGDVAKRTKKGETKFAFY
jgi:hypothetical protein